MAGRPACWSFTPHLPGGYFLGFTAVGAPIPYGNFRPRATLYQEA